jgi:two-component system chemotaxis sensor kinase CheA
VNPFCQHGLEGNYGAIPGISAATILGDGQIALIVDPEALIALAGPTSMTSQKQKVGA